MRTRIAAAACAALLVVGGCGTDDDPGSPGAEATGGTEATEGGASGEVGTGGEIDAPEPVDEQGSASVAGLPIGGQITIEAAGEPACGGLSWNSSELLPDGVTVVVTGITGAPGVTVASDPSCGQPPCTDVGFTAEQLECALTLAWDGTAWGDATFVDADLDGQAVCASQEVCDAVADTFSLGSTMTVELPQPADASS